LALTVAVTWFIVDRVGLQLAALRDLDSSAWIPRAIPFLAASALLLLAHLGSTIAWGLIVRELGGPPIPMAAAVRIFWIASLGRYLPGKVWQIAGLAALARGRGVPHATAVGAAVLGQGISLIAAAAVGMGAFLGGPAAYRRWGIVGAAGVGLAVVLVAIPPVFRRLAAMWFRLARTEDTRGLASAHAVAWLGIYVVNWTLYGLAFLVLARSLGLTGPFLPLVAAFPAAYLLGYLMVFAPAGLGPREGFLILFLTPHVGAASAGVLAVVSRLWTTILELVPGVFFWTRHVAEAERARSATHEKTPRQRRTDVARQEGES